MRRGPLVLLAVAVVLAGCPADTDSDTTVTPAPVPAVPTSDPVETRATSDDSCDVPTPPAPGGLTPAPRESAGPASIPLTNDTVDVAGVLERHEAELSRHRYRLTTPVLSVASTPNHSVALVTSRSFAAGIEHYIVDGRRHSFYSHEGGGRATYSVTEYDGGSVPTVYGENTSLTGADLLGSTLGRYPHEVETVRADDWTVLGADIHEPTTVDNRTITHLDSTVLIDQRGIVRSVDRRLGYSVDDEVHWDNETLDISAIGTAQFDRPYWVCFSPGVLERESPGS